MTTDNSSSLPVQRAYWQDDYMQSAQVSVTDTICQSQLLIVTYITQTLGGLDDDLCSSGHDLAGNNSADPYGPHSAMNYVNALPPTGYTGNMGYDDPPHLATVSVPLRSLWLLC